MENFLIYSVTAFGFLLLVLSFTIIFLGKRIPGESGGQQKLEFKGLKLTTSGIIFLCFLATVVTLFPLSIQAWLQNQELLKKNQELFQKIEELSNQIKCKKMQPFITGTVLDINQHGLKGADVAVYNEKDYSALIRGEKVKPLGFTTIEDSSGAFEFNFKVEFCEGDGYRVVVSKEGYDKQIFVIGSNGTVLLRSALTKSE